MLYLQNKTATDVPTAGSQQAPELYSLDHDSSSSYREDSSSDSLSTPSNRKLLRGRKAAKRVKYSPTDKKKKKVTPDPNAAQTTTKNTPSNRNGNAKRQPPKSSSGKKDAKGNMKKQDLVDELERKEKELNTLNLEIAYLKKKVTALEQGEPEKSPEYFKPVIDENAVRARFASLAREVSNWVAKYASIGPLVNTRYLDRVKLMNYVGRTMDRASDTFSKAFDETCKTSVGCELLLEVCLSRHVYSRLIQNPYHLIQQGLKDQGLQVTNTTHFDRIFNAFADVLWEAGGEHTRRASSWVSQTLNAVYPRGQIINSFDESNFKLIARQFLEGLVPQLLEQEMTPKKETEMRLEFCQLTCIATMLAIDLWRQGIWIKCHSIGSDFLGFEFQSRYGIMEPHPMMDGAADWRNGSLDGRRMAMIMRPAVTATWFGKQEPKGVTVLPALVWLEALESSSNETTSSSSSDWTLPSDW